MYPPHTPVFKINDKLSNLPLVPKIVLSDMVRLVYKDYSGSQCEGRLCNSAGEMRLEQPHLAGTATEGNGKCRD